MGAAVILPLRSGAPAAASRPGDPEVPGEALELPALQARPRQKVPDVAGRQGPVRAEGREVAESSRSTISRESQ